jgi:peptidoglycan/xylan/chitin deacetylase (PgdA/CDA1 family)
LCAALTLALLLPGGVRAAPDGPAPLELHQRLDVSDPVHAKDVALTLDACGGGYDRDTIATLVRLRVPATLFVTRIWLDRHPAALRELLAHPELFELENHGSRHVPAVVGRRLYGMQGASDSAGVAREVDGGAQAVMQATGRAPRWFRGAGAAYDVPSLQVIARLGYPVAGFSLNADDGATLGAASVAKRLRQMKTGDIVIAHMNRPASGTAEGLAAALPELLGRGVRFVKLSQAAGVEPARQPKAVR